MSKLIVLRGLPGSGKSTLAKQMIDEDPGNVIQVNRDDLRLSLHNNHWMAGQTESMTVAVRDAIIRQGLKAGKTVICSDTNLSASSVKEMLKIAVQYNAEVEYIDVEVSLEECIRRDSLREKPVGENVIRDMHKRFFRGDKFPDRPKLRREGNVTIIPYVADHTQPKAYLVDLDGTIAINDGHRSHYDYTNVFDDKPNEDVIRVVQELGHYYELIFLSGREDSCYEDTRRWISQHIGGSYTGDNFDLFMRKTGDQRPDYVVKLELFNEHIRDQYNVLGAFDDRNQVVRVWRELGITVFQVADGDF